jgi:hypothetical protein
VTPDDQRDPGAYRLATRKPTVTFLVLPARRHPTRACNGPTLLSNGALLNQACELMKLLSRFVLCLCTSIVLLVGLCGLGHCCGLDLGLDQFAELARETERGEILKQRTRCVTERTVAKQQITNDVIERRKNLLEAVAAFRQVHQASDVDGPQSAIEKVDLSDEGLSCNVLSWARAQAADDPSRAGRVHELESEFAQHFHHSAPE